MENTVSDFLKLLKIPMSPKLFKRLVQSHPDYPSLLSIADVLDRFGIKKQVFRIEKDKLIDLPFPYLLHLKKNGGELALIKNQNDLKKEKDELEYWSGVVLQVEPTNSISDVENKRIYSDEKYFKFLSSALMTAAGMLVVMAGFNSFTWLNSLLLISSLSGILVGYFLVSKDLGIKNKTIDSFCKTGKKADCDQVLKSEGATIFGKIKLSEAVLSYFIFQLIMLGASVVLPNEKSSVLFVLSAISILTIPFIVFSLYYQGMKAKIWCKLCLVVDAILFLQLGLFSFVFYTLKPQANDHTLFVSFVILLAFIIIASSISLLKSKLEQAIKLSNVGIKASRIKNSATVFTHLLFQQQKIDDTFFDYEISMGSPDAPIKIIMISNLFCKPCKDQHEALNHLIETYSQKVNLTMLFVPANKKAQNGFNSNQYLIQYWLENIYGKENKSSNTAQLMHDWYSLMDIEKFEKKHELKESELCEASKKIELQQSEWINKAKIYNTPTFFINGYKLPNFYNAENIIDLVPGLSDWFEKQENKLREKAFPPI